MDRFWEDEQRSTAREGHDLYRASAPATGAPVVSKRPAVIVARYQSAQALSPSTLVDVELRGIRS